MAPKQPYFKRRWREDPIGLIFNLVSLVALISVGLSWYVDRRITRFKDQMVIKQMQKDNRRQDSIAAVISLDIQNLETAVAKSTVTTGKVVTAVEILTGITIKE